MEDIENNQKNIKSNKFADFLDNDSPTEEEIAEFDDGGKLRAVVKITKIAYTSKTFKIVFAKIISVKSGTPYYSFNRAFGSNRAIISMKGDFETPVIGETYMLVGQLEPNKEKKFRPGYRVLYLGDEVLLESSEDEKAFLLSLLTENQVNELYKTYENPFEIIKNKDVESLLKVKGIGETVANRIITKYSDNIHKSGLLSYFQQNDIALGSVDKIIEAYGTAEQALVKIKENPYSLISVGGIGFKRADNIAMKLGISPDSIFRYKELIIYLLTLIANEGDTWIAPSVFMEQICYHIGAPNYKKNINIKAFEELYEEKRIYYNDTKTFICLRENFLTECRIYRELKRLLEAPNEFKIPENLDEVISNIENRQGFEFTDEQKKAILMVLQNNVVAITGKGGSGKTSVTNGFLNIFPTIPTELCALSGRAACRISEVSGHEAKTIHRLLTQPTKISNASIIVLDEATMVDIHLFYKLISNIKEGSKFIIMGDIAQLETIGCGNVFGDILNSHEIPTMRLTKIHRQAAKSAIITESIKISNGQQITPQGWTGTEVRGELQDLELDIFCRNPYAPDLAFIKSISHWKKEYQRLKNIEKIAVITAMKDRGCLNVMMLNNEIQEIYNPSDPVKQEITLSRRYNKDINEKSNNNISTITEELGKTYYIRFRENDRVMNMKNDYHVLKIDSKLDTTQLLSMASKTYLSKLEDEENDSYLSYTSIFNGYLGTIEQLSNFGMIINFDLAERVFIPSESFDVIDLGYACTVHKYQGSECDTVIFAMDKGVSYTLANKQMLYTGITRAKSNCILVSDDTTLRSSIMRDNVRDKNTLLINLFKGKISLATDDEEYENLVKSRKNNKRNLILR